MPDYSNIVDKCGKCGDHGDGESITKTIDNSRDCIINVDQNLTQSYAKRMWIHKCAKWILTVFLFVGFIALIMICSLKKIEINKA